MSYLYIDHNIFIQTLYVNELKTYLCQLSNKNVNVIYSPAHIEEIHKVYANEQSNFKDRMPGLLANISEITNNKESFPTAKGLVIKIENPNECYLRVSEYDTRDRVEVDGLSKMGVDKKHYAELLAQDKHNQSISNIPNDKIWEHPAVKQIVDDLNNNIQMIIQQNNSSIDVKRLYMLGINKKLPSSFKFKRGNFSRLVNSHKELEYTIEVLFRVLNYCGYYADKKPETAISGIHDVSHAIYATKADVFVTTDNRFAQRCMAVYSFLGIKTKVIACKEEEILNTIKNL